MNLFDDALDMGDDPFNPLNVTRSSTTAGTTTAASRQKSCNACVRGKRRCDKIYPKCTRCAAKGLDCVYQKLPPVPASASSPSESSSSMGVGQNHLHKQSTNVTADFDMSGFEMPQCNLGPNAHTTTTGTGANTATTGTTTPAETLALDPNLDFSVADLINGTQHTHSIWDLPGFLEPKAQFPAPVPIPNFGESQSHSEDLEQRQPMRDIAILQEANLEGCIATDPLLVHDPRSRMGFVLSYIRDCHKTFAQTRALPFMHPRLYAQHLPRTVMSAFCAASTYATHTPTTKAWALRVLSEAAKEVQNEGRNNAVSVLDKIARVQAIVIIDTMRMLDGDISMRAAAEREQGVILEWVDELARVREELEGEDSPVTASRDKPPKSWEHWILTESLRRTIMMSMAFLCLLCVLKEQIRKPRLPLLYLPEIMTYIYPADDALWQRTLAFTASKHLWEAPTSVEFFRAWRERPQWAIQNNSFKDFWQYARSEDCDEFTKLMLTTQVGPDAMDHFMQGETAIPYDKPMCW